MPLAVLVAKVQKFKAEEIKCTLVIGREPYYVQNQRVPIDTKNYIKHLIDEAGQGMKFLTSLPFPSLDTNKEGRATSVVHRNAYRIKFKS